MAKLYTRTGDAGTTGLLGPERVSKDDPRIEAIGAVDELNTVLGVTVAAQRSRKVRQALVRIQDDLFTVGAELAMPAAAKEGKLPAVGAQHVARLENLIEGFEAGEMKEFVVPGGSEALTRLHWARAVARRAERRIVTLSRRDEIGPHLLRYMNRLSSLLYQMSVWLQKKEGRRSQHPTYRA